MSAVERKSKKIYYTMGEVSEMFDVNPSLIRFWEQKFDILKPDKNKKGNRLFTPADVENLKLIYHLVKENGMTLAGAQKRLKQNPGGLDRNLEIVERLQHIRAMLLEVRQELKGAGEETVEIFVDTESVPDEPLAKPLPASLSEPSQTDVPVVRSFDPEAETDADAPLVPFQLQELWPEDEYPKSDTCMNRPENPDFGGFVVESDPGQDELVAESSATLQESVSDSGFGNLPDKTSEPARPQVIEQTLF